MKLTLWSWYWVGWLLAFLIPELEWAHRDQGLAGRAAEKARR